MAIHDWKRVDAGLFHHFHQFWATSLCNALNSKGLPSQYFALVEQNISGPIPDVLTLRLDLQEENPDDGGVAVATVPPKTGLIQKSEASQYARKANRIAVRHRHGDVVAIIEIVSPGNKASRTEFNAFVNKTVELIEQGIHVLAIDLFPPGPRDPQGIHQAIWEQFDDEAFSRPADKPLTLASYDAGTTRVAYVEFAAVGDELTDMPLFLKPGSYVPTPLNATYNEAWASFPRALKGLLDNG